MEEQKGLNAKGTKGGRGCSTQKIWCVGGGGPDTDPLATPLTTEAVDSCREPGSDRIGLHIFYTGKLQQRQVIDELST